MTAHVFINGTLSFDPTEGETKNGNPKVNITVYDMVYDFQTEKNKYVTYKASLYDKQSIKIAEKLKKGDPVNLFGLVDDIYENEKGYKSIIVQQASIKFASRKYLARDDDSNEDEYAF